MVDFYTLNGHLLETSDSEEPGQRANHYSVATSNSSFGSIDTDDTVAETQNYEALASNRFDSMSLNSQTSTIGNSQTQVMGKVRIAQAGQIFSALPTRKTGSQSYDDCASQQQQWSVNLLRFGPLSGVFCMLLALCSIVASLGVLVVSDQKAADSWPTSPSTYLAIFTAIVNLSIRYSACQGVIIAWWRGARTGSTIERLHFDWLSGTTFKGAITSGRHVGLLGLVCIFSTLVVIDGPLLQRSSSLGSAPVALNTTLAPQVPTDFTGTWEFFDMNVNWPLNRTIPTASGFLENNVLAGSSYNFPERSYFSDGSLPRFIHGCPSGTTCKARIMAPALAVTSCASYVVPIELTTLTKENFGLNGSGLLLNEMLFAISISLVIEHYDTINVITGIASTNDDIVGDFNLTACTLESAVGEYDVTINSGVATLNSPASPKIVSLSRNTRVIYRKNSTSTPYPSTLAGVVGAAYEKWGTATAAINGASKYSIFSSAPETVEKYVLDWSTKHARFADPRDDVLADLNQLMVRAGIAAAAKSTSYLRSHMDDGMLQYTNSTIKGYLEHSVFQAEYKFWALAAALEIMCIALIAPTYWGWWNLGRTVSFSPLEIARAFESPLLSDCNSNSSGRDIAKALRGVSLRYGVVTGDGTESRLAFSKLGCGSSSDGGSVCSV